MNSSRRVVTRIDRSGKSDVISDGAPPVVFRPEGTTDIEIAEIWATASPTKIPSDSSDPTLDGPPFLPAPGESRFRIVIIEPTKSFELASALHRADIVEYLIVLTGQIQLTLPFGEAIELMAGDLIVQEGTEHAWYNPFSKPCVIGVILLGTQPFIQDTLTN